MLVSTRLATATVAAGVVLAGILLFRVPALRRVRWVVTAIDAYASVALIHVAFVGISLHAALAGEGLSRSLPQALQGASIAAFVILPSVWVLSIVRLGVRRFRHGRLVTAALQAIAMTTCIALVVAALPTPSVAPARVAGAMTPASVAAVLDKSLGTIAAGERATSRDRWDPDFIVARVGHDPRRLFSWVQDHTYWIPYRGALRGAVGVLLDGQGNSLDRAILLATLLRKGGHTVRLAHGNLTQEQAASSFSRVVMRRSVDFWRPANLNNSAQPDIRAIALWQVVGDVASLPRISLSEDPSAKLEAELNGRVRDQVDRLLRHVGHIPGDDREKRKEVTLTALRDHWWVQRQEGPSWVDLDLLAEDSQPHLDVEDVAATEIEDIPYDLWHQLVIRVVEERSSTRGTSQHTTLEYMFRPADVIGQPIVLQFLPVDWTHGSHQLLSTSNVQSAFLDYHEWMAGLTIGTDTVATALLAEEVAGTQGPVGGNASHDRGGAFGGLGSALETSLANKKPQEAQQLTGVWIEYETRCPEATPRRVRRTIVDLLGQSRRDVPGSPSQGLRLDVTARRSRSLALTTRTEVLPLVSELPNDFAAHLAAGSLLAASDVLHDVASGRLGRNAEADRRRLASARLPSTALLTLALTRFRGNRSADVFVDRINVLTRHESLVSADGVALRRAFDIVSNDVGIGLATRDGFAARIEQGVRDTNAEALLIRGGALGSTAEAFAVSSGWIVLHPNDAIARERSEPWLDFVRNSKQEIGGYIFVVPRSAVRVGGEMFSGGWRIDPETGTTLGIAVNGWGQAAEYGRQMNLAVTFSRGFVFEYALCQSFPLAMNSIRIINEEVFGGWQPGWTSPAAKSKDPVDVADENMNMCIVQAIAAGFAATLPLILMTWRVSEPGRTLAFVKRAMAEEEEFEALTRSCVGSLRESLADRVFAFVLPSLAAASFQGCGPRDTLPDLTKYGPNRTIVETPDPNLLKSTAKIDHVPTTAEVDLARNQLQEISGESARRIGNLVRYRAEAPVVNPAVENRLRELAESYFDNVYSPAVDRFVALESLWKYFNG